MQLVIKSNVKTLSQPIYIHDTLYLRKTYIHVSTDDMVGSFQDNLQHGTLILSLTISVT